MKQLRLDSRLLVRIVQEIVRGLPVSGLKKCILYVSGEDPKQPITLIADASYVKERR